jgi:hypothetical protein
MAAKRHRLAQRRKTIGFTQEKLAELPFVWKATILPPPSSGPGSADYPHPRATNGVGPIPFSVGTVAVQVSCGVVRVVW